MIGFRSERERTRERRLSLARAAIFFLWVILVFALVSLFLSIHNESITSNNTRSSRSSHSIRPPPSPWPRPLSRTLFHAPPSTTTTTQARLVSSNGDPEHSFYEDDKRIIHTGPNPLHN